jgi:hypothetical protein
MSATAARPAFPSVLRPIVRPAEKVSPYYDIVIKAVLIATVVSSPGWLGAMFFTSPRDYPFISSMLFVPIIATISIVMLSFRWHQDRYLKLVLATGTILRVAVAGVHIWLGMVFYDAAVDAFHYWTVGLQLADEFRFHGWSTFRPPYWSSWLIDNVCGVITVFLGNALPALMVMFAMAGLWGGYFFYRAFCLAFPQGNHRLYAALVILLPSTVFWSSTIGKDALCQLFIGIAAYGYAKGIHKPNSRALLICGFGIACTTAIRPHVAAMLAMAVTFTYIFGRKRRTYLTAAARLFLIPALLAGAYFVTATAGTFVGTELGDAKADISSVDRLTRNTQIGDSAYNQGESLPMRLAQAPFLLYRPFLWEAHNFMSAFAALEGTVLLLFTWNRRHVLRRLLRDWRQPFVGFILLYALEFTVAFAAATSNFGIIVRQRIMLLPLVLMLFCGRAETKEEASVRKAGRRASRFFGPRAFAPVRLSTGEPNFNLRHLPPPNWRRR